MRMEWELRTGTRTEFIDITDRVRAAVESARMREGSVLLFTPHTTAGLTINENADPDVLFDLTRALERLAPHQAGYRHGEGNSDAHLKSSLVGCSLTVPVSSGRLDLGSWQGIYFCEFDGPRTRKVRIYLHPVSG
jgi:secondary thiamine-phosphate synthase enzyme